MDILQHPAMSDLGASPSLQIVVLLFFLPFAVPCNFFLVAGHDVLDNKNICDLSPPDSF